MGICFYQNHFQQYIFYSRKQSNMRQLQLTETNSQLNSELQLLYCIT